MWSCCCAQLSIDLSPESKKHWFLRTGSVLPFFSCTFPPQKQFVLSFHKCSFPSPRFFLLLFPTCTCASSRDQRSMIPKSRKADRHAAVNSHFPVVCISLACDHAVQAMSGLEKRKPSPALTIGFSMRRECHRLIRCQQLQQLMPILGSILLRRSRVRLPALPIQGSVVSTSPLASMHRISRHLFGT